MTFSREMREKNSFSFLSLRTVFSVAVMLGLLIPASLIGTITYNLQRENLTAHQKKDQLRLLDIVALGMQEPLWNLNDQAGVPLVSSVMEDPSVISIQIIDKQSNRVFLSVVRNERRVGRVAFARKPIVYQGEEIGLVTMEFDTENLVATLQHQLKNLLLILSGQLILSILLIMGALHFRFLKPVRQLTEQATQLAELKLDSPFYWDRLDEIGLLGKHLEWTRRELKRLIDELKTKTLALEADIARRREVEEALRRSETRYRELFCSNLDGIVISSLDGQIIDANPAFLNLMCFTLEQLKQQNFWALVGPESEALERFNIEHKVLCFGYCDEFEATYINRFANLVPVSVKTVALRDSAGRINAVWRMVRDISERRAAEERMQLAAKVYENTAEGIMITDNHQYIRSVNRAFSKITGYSQQDVLGKKPNILSSGRHDAHFYEQMWKALNEQDFWQGEIWNRRKNGEVYPEWLTINCVKNAIGSVIHYVAIFSDQTERKAADERIQFLAHFDVLTGLPNRVHMQDRVELAIHNADRDHQAMALLLLDLDRFKTINESLGHAAGDTLLQVAAERIKSVLGPGETVARQGGDEFIILLPTITSLNEAALVAEKVREAFVQVVELHNHVITISPSIGISIFPNDGRDFGTLVRNADTAMYHAKSSGRNCFKFYTADLNARAREILAIESQLRFALERDEFLLYYQPLIETLTGRVLSAEALLRWNHPMQGILSPARFIDVAEESGLIVQIGTWVIREACKQLASWVARGLTPITLAVNLSASQFRQQDLAQTLEQLLTENCLPGHLLDIEVTESVVMEDAEATIQTIESIKRMGLQLSIDDFGTGYSSLSYLKRFKADKLKIDRSFVCDIPGDPDDSAIARAIINMAQSLNMKVVAEGVESIQQWRFLADQGCDLVQGYLLASPMVADEFAELLASGKVLFPPDILPSQDNEM